MGLGSYFPTLDVDYPLGIARVVRRQRPTYLVALSHGILIQQKIVLRLGQIKPSQASYMHLSSACRYLALLDHSYMLRLHPT